MTFCSRAIRGRESSPQPRARIALMGAGDGVEIHDTTNIPPGPLNIPRARARNRRVTAVVEAVDAVLTS
jgi:hypothetical protein